MVCKVPEYIYIVPFLGGMHCLDQSQVKPKLPDAGSLNCPAAEARKTRLELQQLKQPAVDHSNAEGQALSVISL